MRFDVITLFPELFAPFQSVGVTRRAFENKSVDVRLWPLRDFAEDTYRRVDDRAYGGGPGMVMLVEPLTKALGAIQADQALQGLPAPLPVILFSPAGKPLTQARVQSLAQSPGAVLLCGRYEGIDQRFIDAHVDEEISLGDYVLSGGELPALTLIDAVARLQPGVLNDAASHQQDSFSDGLLDCPHYSRPEVLTVDGVEMAVPPLLMSGHHAHIAKWRREQQLTITARRRPELIEIARQSGALSKEDERFLKTLLL
ncbi:tRNA (guanosine(37)-N1)-methyltransferase TrmD [Aquabacterium sp. CECT 9606]|uniref:tRNA (guanosine(37)-N1)-methyltransferase TrmD n=1 Tax=Aquabacterium sp. CECT 9606 TaxID=2845822 RepID=UPI001E3C23F7|nr:tRNA (guanosine(37)-N1)-methyltransferase TrmD [Aquabacterium sp. CECT 9606]CAH0354373.1 tRNA (guanine-N(1)-)-methyltransferase [Aquabacterium sp. CECT 9606]